VLDHSKLGDGVLQKRAANGAVSVVLLGNFVQGGRTLVTVFESKRRFRVYCLEPGHKMEIPVSRGFMSNGHRSLSQHGIRAWRQPLAPKLRWVMRTVRCCLVLVILTCCRLFGQTDASGSSSGSQSNPSSSLPRQTAPSEGTSGSSLANPSVEASTRLVIVKFQEPEYPIEARRQQIQGQVWVHLVITETGDVESAEAISGNPLLAAATVKAMKQWKFKPYIRNGHPVRVSTKLSHDFAFQDRVKDVTDGTDATQGKVLSNPSAPADLPALPRSDSDGNLRPSRLE
jgi:TonB family protein